MSNKVQETLSALVAKFQSGEIPKAIAITQFPTYKLPMNKWSFLNKLICRLTGLTDFRGFRQWQEANRFVKKGSSATYILVPRIKSEDDEKILLGFLAKPVFSVEQTEGEALDYQQIELPEIPLIERAKEWGVNVNAVAGNKEFYGRFSPSRQEISLASSDECVFFHELVHLAESRLMKMKQGQDPLQEIVADLGALALCCLVGKDGEAYLGNTYRYIQHYAIKLRMTPYNACIKVLNRVDKAINLILGKNETNNVAVSETSTDEIDKEISQTLCRNCQSVISIEEYSEIAYCETCKSLVFTERRDKCQKSM